MSDIESRVAALEHRVADLEQRGQPRLGPKPPSREDVAQQAERFIGAVKSAMGDTHWTDGMSLGELQGIARGQCANHCQDDHQCESCQALAALKSRGLRAWPDECRRASNSADKRCLCEKSGVCVGHQNLADGYFCGKVQSLPAGLMPAPVDRLKVCTTSGEPVAKVRAAQTAETGQHAAYIVLCDEERAKGFVRPYRDRYKHAGPLKEMTGAAGDFTVRVGGCGTVTTMGRALSETYARVPKFYGSTFCCGCNRHLPVAEFVWTADQQEVGS